MGTGTSLADSMDTPQEYRMPQTDEQLSIDQIYEKLTQGLGHEFVNDDNVFALIERAERDRHTVLAQELREWQSPCG
jgi:hypothetical protein